MKHRKQTAAIIAIVVLSTVNLITLLLLFRKTPAEQAKDYPLVDIARSYIPQEHFIVNIQPLRDKLFEIVEAEGPDSISIYYEYLNTGANIQINNETRHYPASLVKVPSAMVAMKKVEKGEWQMDSRLVLFEEDKDPRYGDLYKQPVGTTFSIEQLLQELLRKSDNTAHRILMRNLSEEELDELRDVIGLNELFDSKQEVSAKEYSRLFRALYNSSFLNRDGSQKLLGWLSQTPFDKTLASGLSDYVTFSHKIGEDDEEKNYLDSGIVYEPHRPYLITVMVKGKSQAESEQIMKRISQVAYEYVKNDSDENE